MTTTLESGAILNGLSNGMHAAAAHSNRLISLQKLADAIAPDDFYRLAGQAPGTIARDLAAAHDDYQSARQLYESYCAEIGISPYVTYNVD